MLEVARAGLEEGVGAGGGEDKVPKGRAGRGGGEVEGPEGGGFAGRAQFRSHSVILGSL